MGKYKEVREVIVNSLSDKQWHGVDEIQSKCEEEGINLEGNRGPIYNVVHQLKKKLFLMLQNLTLRKMNL